MFNLAELRYSAFKYLKTPSILTKKRNSLELPDMEWDGEKIRDLRLRMGWSASDLARRLQVDPVRVSQLEAGIESAEDKVLASLDLIFKQAEMSADSITFESLAEIVFVEDEVTQVDSDSIHSKFQDH